MIISSFPRLVFAIFAAICLSACSQSLTERFGQGIAMSPSEPSRNDKGVPEMVRPSFAQFQDIPIPDGAKMNIERTLILGENEAWIGRLVIDSTASTSSLFDFFKYRTSQFGWQEITSVRAETSVLSYSRDNRIMTIQIQSHALHAIVGTQIHITMSPKGNSASNRSSSDLAGGSSSIAGNQIDANPASLRPVEIR